MWLSFWLESFTIQECSYGSALARCKVVPVLCGRATQCNRGEVLPHKVLTLRSPSRVGSFTTLFDDPSRLRVCGLSIMTKQRVPDSH